MIRFIKWYGVVNCSPRGVELKSGVWFVKACLMLLVGGRWINLRTSTGGKERIYRWWKSREKRPTKLTGYTIFSAQNRFVCKKQYKLNHYCIHLHTAIVLLQSPCLHAIFLLMRGQSLLMYHTTGSKPRNIKKKISNVNKKLTNIFVNALVILWEVEQGHWETVSMSKS